MLLVRKESILDAALTCIGRWGVAKTSLDDVARVAGCSRTTVYRACPGGKDALMASVAAAEVAALGDAIGRRMAAATTLGEALTGAVTEAGRRLGSHSGLQFLLAHEPGTIVPWLAFRRGEEVLRYAGSLAAPFLARWLGPDDAHRAGEWAARLVLSYALCPTRHVDLTDEASVRRLVTTFVLPALTPRMLP